MGNHPSQRNAHPNRILLRRTHRIDQPHGQPRPSIPTPIRPQSQIRLPKARAGSDPTVPMRRATQAQHTQRARKPRYTATQNPHPRRLCHHHTPEPISSTHGGGAARSRIRIRMQPKARDEQSHRILLNLYRRK